MNNEILEFHGLASPSVTNRVRPIMAYHSSRPVASNYHWQEAADATSSVTVALNHSMASWVIVAFKKLESLGNLRPGWDSHGGLPLKQEARQLIVQTIQKLREINLPVPTVALDPGGMGQVEWKGGGGELDMDVGPGLDVEYVKYDREGKPKEGYVDLDEPAELGELAYWLLHG